MVLERSERVSWVKIRKRTSGGKEWFVVSAVIVGVYARKEQEEDERICFCCLFCAFL